MATCDGTINLNTPSGSERVRGFQPPWRTVYKYNCPKCGQESRVRANSYLGKRAVPGVGGITCGKPIPESLTDFVKNALTEDESREQMIQRWEKEGWLDPKCPSCKEFYDSPRKPCDVFAPNHKANSWCESGKRPHCTCDACF